MSLYERNVKIFIRIMRARFGHYKSPKSGRHLSGAIIQELQMDSLFAQAYAAIVEAGHAVDRENEQLRTINAELTRQLEEASKPPEVPDPVEHDGGFITTPKGRQVGTDEDRKALDDAIDRLDVGEPTGETPTEGEPPEDAPPAPDGSGPVIQ